MALKYAYMSFSCPDATREQMFDWARQFGNDAIELRIQAKHSHGVELETPADERQAIREQAEAAAAPICGLACTTRFADPEQTDDSVAVADRAIDLTADVGGGVLRVFGGRFPDTVSRAAAIENLVGGLKRVADHAQERGVTLAVETHDAWTDCDHVAAVMEQVDHPAVGVNWDPMHPLRQSGWTIERQWERLGRWVRHVHTHDGTLRLDQLKILPMGTGEIDHAPAIRALRDAGFTGYVSVEYEASTPAPEHLPHEIKTMKQYEQS
jgi:sugar phosphate isomerase/epimerase